MAVITGTTNNDTINVPGQTYLPGGSGGVTINGVDSNNANFLLFAAAAVTQDNVITGNIGDDVIIAGIGNDTIDGGTGDDNINAGAGDDLIIDFDTTNDSVDGGSGTDTLQLTTSLPGTRSIKEIGRASCRERV